MRLARLARFLRTVRHFRLVQFYAQLRHVLSKPLLKVQGTVSRREGTLNIVVGHASPLAGLEAAPKAKNWG